MKKMDRKLIEVLSKDIMISLTEEEMTSMLEEADNFMVMLELLNKVNTDNVEAMHYPFEEVIGTLRDDVVNHELDQSLILKNAPLTQDDYFEVVKVVKK